jgi:hypothetical protein
MEVLLGYDHDLDGAVEEGVSTVTSRRLRAGGFSVRI